MMAVPPSPECCRYLSCELAHSFFSLKSIPSIRRYLYNVFLDRIPVVRMMAETLLPARYSWAHIDARSGFGCFGLPKRTPFFLASLLPSSVRSLIKSLSNSADCRMLHRIEPVEIFHQFPFLFLIQFNDVACRELVWVVSDGLVDVSCDHTIDFGHVTVDDDLLVAQRDNPTAYLLDIFKCTYIDYFFVLLCVTFRPIVMLA